MIVTDSSGCQTNQHSVEVCETSIMDSVVVVYFYVKWVIEKYSSCLRINRSTIDLEEKCFWIDKTLPFIHNKV